jgi:hypothetical protein
MLELMVQKNTDAEWFVEKYKGLFPRLQIQDVKKMSKSVLTFIKSKRWFAEDLIADLKRLEDIDENLKRMQMQKIWMLKKIL